MEFYQESINITNKTKGHIMTNKKALLDLFKNQTKTITVKAWNNMEVGIRELSVSEANDIQSEMLKDSTLDEISKGQINIDIKKMEILKIKKVAIATVDKDITEAFLNSLPESAKEGISELYEAIQATEEPKK